MEIFVGRKEKRSATPTCSPLVFRHMALSKLGREERTSRVTGMGLLMTEFKTTPGSPLSCRAESWDGSWKMNAVVTSVAEKMRGETRFLIRGGNK